MKKNSKFAIGYLGIIFAVMYLPIIIVIIYSFNSSDINTLWEGLSTKWYTALLNDTDLMGALKNSLVLATISSLTAGVIGTLGAIGMSHLNFPGKGIIEYLSSIPIMTPEIIIAMIFLAYFSLLFNFIPLTFGMVTLYIAHTAFSIPYVFMMVQARLVGLDPSYEEAARDLGATPTRAFLDVTLPAVLPAVVSGMLLAFAMSMDDVVISIFVTGARSNTLPIKIYTQIKKGSVSPKINALCTIMFLATTLVVVTAGIIGSRNQQSVQPKIERKSV